MVVNGADLARFEGNGRQEGTKDNSITTSQHWFSKSMLIDLGDDNKFQGMR